MSTSFTKKSVSETLILLVGAVVAVAGKQQDSALLLGLGILVIGVGVFWGGVSAIGRRRVAFMHAEARFVTHRFTGGAAVFWGLLLVLTGLVLAGAGIGIALGFRESLRSLVEMPGAWLTAGGIALAFISAAAFWQSAFGGEHKGMRRLLTLPSLVLAALGVLLGAGLAGTGAWGLQDPAGLSGLGSDLLSAAKAWLGAS